MAKRPRKPKAKGKEAAPSGLSEAAKPYEAEVEPMIEWTKIGPGGRVVIPAAMRRMLGMDIGAHVQLRVVGEELHVLPSAVAHRKIQDLVAKYSSGDGESWVDALIEERKREFEAEERGE